MLGPVHAESLLTANQLALLVKDNGGDPEEAEALFKRWGGRWGGGAGAGGLQDLKTLGTGYKQRIRGQQGKNIRLCRALGMGW